MSRTVQIELTLEVELDAFHSTRLGCWIISRINQVVAVSPDGRSKCEISGTYTILDYLRIDREGELADLFAQQEP